ACVHQGQIWANSRELRFVLEALGEALPLRVVDARGTVLLSHREQEVVRCVAEGLSNRDIARRLGLTEHTVKNYLFRIFDKLGVSRRGEVVLCAYSVGSGMFPDGRGEKRKGVPVAARLVNPPVMPRLQSLSGDQPRPRQ